MASRHAAPAALPTVTILVPTYNRPKAMLVEALESVIRQDYLNLEVIALDDGSENGTPDVLARFASTYPGRFRFERHENMGQARTLNRGFDLATGDLVGYVADDDMLLPGAVTALVSALVRTPDAVGAYPAYRLIDGDGLMHNEIVPPEWSAADALRNHDPIASVGALVRTEVARAHPWDPELKYTGDYDFWVRVGLTRKLVRVPEVLACHRAHSESMTVAGTGDRRRVTDSISVLDKVYARPDLPAEVLAIRDSAYRAAYITAACQMTGVFNAPGDRFMVADRYGLSVTRSTRRPTGRFARLYYRLPEPVRVAVWTRAPRLVRRVRERARR